MRGDWLEPPHTFISLLIVFFKFLKQLAGFIVHKDIEDDEQGAGIRQAGEAGVIGNQQRFLTVVKGDVGRICPHYRCIVRSIGRA